MDALARWLCEWTHSLGDSVTGPTRYVYLYVNIRVKLFNTHVYDAYIWPHDTEETCDERAGRRAGVAVHLTEEASAALGELRRDAEMVETEEATAAKRQVEVRLEGEAERRACHLLRPVGAGGRADGHAGSEGNKTRETQFNVRSHV